MATDWSLLQTPNFAQAALGGYQAGQKVGQQKRLDAALGGVDLERPETIMPVLQEDPTTGAALLGASTKMAAYKHELAGKAALSDWLIARDKASTAGPASADSPASPTPAPASPAEGAAAVSSAADSTMPTSPAAGSDGIPNEITVTANKPVDPLTAAKLAYMKADPEGYLASSKDADAHDLNVLKRTKDQLDLQGQLLGGVTDQNSYSQALAQAKSMGLDVSNAPAAYNPAWVKQVEQHTLTAKDRIELELKTHADNRADASQAETVRHNHATEGTAAGALGLARQREGREAKKSSGTGVDLSSSTTDALLSAAGL